MHEVQPMNNNNTTILLKHLNQSNFQMLQHQQVQIQPPPSLKCPRCDSNNTKFCYYNNYNLSQPRHFCKNCRRYWTKGGVLRNVPVGGGCRKSKRSSSSSTSSNKSYKAKTGTNISSNRQQSNCHSSSDSSTALCQVVPDGLFSSSEIEGFMKLSPENNNKSISNINNINNNNYYDNDNGNDVAQIGNVVCTTSFSEYIESQGIQDWDMGKMVGAVDLDNSTDRIEIEDLLESRGSNVGLTTLDWNLTANNDPHQRYWGQSTVDDDHDSQWCDSTNTSYLPLFLP